MLSLDRIAEAAEVVDPAFRNTPQFIHAALSRELGRDLVLKIETLNPIRSFKGRGADYYMRDLSPGQHVVCASAGNFGQAIAYAGRARDVAVTVFAAKQANPLKVDRMRELGADVVLDGDDFDAAKARARDHAAERSECVFVEDGQDPRIAEGAGTIAVELAPLDLDAVIVPVGNGALISGIGSWLKAHSPRTRIVGVCAEAAPSMAISWRSGEPTATDTATTIADGIAVRVPVPEAIEWMRDVVDDIVLVSEAQIRQALWTIRDAVGMIVEPAGAMGVAGALVRRLSGATQATIVTGSNISSGLMRELAPEPR
jgi:threonine dehydratase